VLALIAGAATAVAASLRSLVRALGRLVLRRLAPARLPRFAAGAQSPGAFVSAAVTLTLIVAALWARLVEPRWLRVEHLTLPMAQVHQPIRLVLISDLHSDARFDLDAEVAATVNDLHADIVLYAGDTLNASSRLNSARQSLTAMRATTGKFAVRGNWDAWFWSELDLFGGTGFEEITSGWRTITVKGTSIHLGGHEWVDAWAPRRVVGQPPAAEGITILLYHAHDYLEAAAAAHVDLYLCGDTHAGQIRLPFYGALFAVGRFGRKYDYGLFEIGKTHGYVSAGLGVERGFPYRFMARPAITVIELVPTVP